MSGAPLVPVVSCVTVAALALDTSFSAGVPPCSATTSASPTALVELRQRMEHDAPQQIRLSWIRVSICFRLGK